ncbi:4-aminobutyrate aminotransferase [Rhodobium orientis]|uniref:Aspartate aminotransferase family protein n=1 Tax=Rhodobium orientis TaxID=34017 RepID=A0A327JU79_9HYPH|nr:aspartate aminotransferase family protein [Rhodobium orientis]MBB4302551.1 4-aminobutyrate aminotransferase [Rhodobium orientis]MBK5949400.1 aspartate aminotransferase family protein [Rhodobium orientis]RAI29165.1 aspartate aminotransferase family protein [Rhodobium orientis]
MSFPLYEKDQKTLSKLQNLRFFPLAVTGGKGSYVTAEDGRKLLDLSASWGAASLGHGHPAYVAAITAAASNPAGASILSAASAPAIRLGERLLALTAGAGERRVWLGHSGSDANETVARAVVAATGRRRLMSFTGAYHGGTAGSMAVSGHSAQEGSDKADGLTLVPFPDPYRPFADDPSGAALLDQIEELLAGPCPGEETAAFFIEPIQSDGGLIVPPPGFFKRLAEICARYGILTVSDEVKVGMGRTGRLHCYMHEDFTPDIVVCGKGLGGGVPISAVIGPARILDFAVCFSMQTLHGNAICCGAAHAVLDTIENEKLIDNAATIGARLLSSLEALKEKHAEIGEVRGRGLAIGVELVTDRATKEPAKELAAKVVYRAFELGLVVYYVGMNSNVLELTPPLTLSAAEADEAVAIISQAISDAAAGRVDDAKLKGFEGW